MKMKTMQRVSLVFGLFAVLAASHPARAADVAKGGDVFAEECAECHSVREGKNKKGPSMFGVVGRKAQAIPTISSVAAISRLSLICVSVRSFSTSASCM